MFSKERKWENSSTREAIQAPKPEIRAIMTRRGHCKKHTIWKKLEKVEKNYQKHTCFSVESRMVGVQTRTGAPRHARTPTPAHNTKRSKIKVVRFVETKRYIFETKNKFKKEVIKNICVFSVKEGLFGLAPARERCDMHEPTRLRTTLADRRGPRVQCLFIYRNSIYIYIYIYIYILCVHIFVNT